MSPSRPFENFPVFYIRPYWMKQDYKRRCTGLSKGHAKRSGLKISIEVTPQSFSWP